MDCQLMQLLMTSAAALPYLLVGISALLAFEAIHSRRAARNLSASGNEASSQNIASPPANGYRKAA